MNLLDAIAGRRGASDDIRPPPWDDYWYSANPGFMTQAGVTINADTAMQVTAVAACVRLLSGTTAKLPIHAFRRSGENGRERDRANVVEHLMNRRPNRWQNAFEFRRQMTAQVALTGNAYAQIVWGGPNVISELIPLRFQTVWIYQEPNGDLLYRGTTRDWHVVNLPASDVFHLRDLTLDGVYGLSRIDQARQGIGLARAAEIYAASYFGNNAEPGVILSVPGKLTDAQRKQVQTEWREQRQGPYKAHKLTVAEGGAKIEKLGATNREGQVIELRGFQVVDIARAYGVPPHLIGDVARQTSWGTGIEQYNIAFLQFSLLDWLAMWEAAIGRDLLFDSEDEYAEHVVDMLLRGDFVARMDGYATAIQNGIMNPDEARARENLNPRPDGKGTEYWKPANMTDPAAAPPPSSRSRSRGTPADQPTDQSMDPSSLLAIAMDDTHPGEEKSNGNHNPTR